MEFNDQNGIQYQNETFVDHDLGEAVLKVTFFNFFHVISCHKNMSPYIKNSQFTSKLVDSH